MTRWIQVNRFDLTAIGWFDDIFGASWRRVAVSLLLNTGARTRRLSSMFVVVVVVVAVAAAVVFVISSRLVPDVHVPRSRL